MCAYLQLCMHAYIHKHTHTQAGLSPKGIPYCAEISKSLPAGTTLHAMACLCIPYNCM